MPQHREQEVPADSREEQDRFNAWAAESRQIMPFIDLAIQWYMGHVTIEEARRIEIDQHLARFLVH